MEAMLNMVDRTGSDAERQQRDLILINNNNGIVYLVRPREISRSEDWVKRTVEAFQSFVNPFHLEISQPMISLSSGAAITYQKMYVYDVLNAL